MNWGQDLLQIEDRVKAIPKKTTLDFNWSFREGVLKTVSGMSLPRCSGTAAPATCVQMFAGRFTGRSCCPLRNGFPQPRFLPWAFFQMGLWAQMLTGWIFKNKVLWGHRTGSVTGTCGS